jgi:Fe2+ or Zn2+ uptake regulation protein
MKQIYKTPIRESIIDYFESHHHPSSLEQICAFLQSQNTICEFSTVFRQVKSMVKSQILTEFFLDDKRKMYELVQTQNHFHYHVICSLCSKVFCEEISDSLYQNLKAILQSPNIHNLELEIKAKGICMQCEILKT